MNVCGSDRPCPSVLYIRSSEQDKSGKHYAILESETQSGVLKVLKEINEQDA